MSGLWDKPIVYLIRPDGGIDIDRMYQAGFRTFLLTMQDTDLVNDRKIKVDGKEFSTYSFDAWDHRKIPAQIDRYPDAVWLPWAFLVWDADCFDLRRCADQAYARQKGKLARPAGCWNAEKPAELYINHHEMIRSAEGCDVLWSTTPWAFQTLHGVETTLKPYSLAPAHWVIDAQMFPSENTSSWDPRSCRARFYEFGFRGDVHFQQGITNAKPEWLPFPEYGRSSVYAGDGVTDWKQWQVRHLDPLPETEFPYLGPFYGPSAPKGKTPSKPNQAFFDLKRTLHTAGYGNFWNADKAFNKPLEEALRRMQRDHGLEPTGQYGRGSWECLRRLASANVGKTWAVRG